MKTNVSVWKWLPLAAAACLCCVLNLPAQPAPAPAITTQPTNQTVLAGTNVTFTVAVSDTAPDTYQWQINGVNLANNIMSTVAGTGARGYTGDGGPATSAELYLPYSVALDAAGNIYFADYYNNRIRKAATNGIITTVAGTNMWGYSGDGGAAINARLYRPNSVELDVWGNLYIADTLNNRVRKVGTNGIITTVAGTNLAGYSGDGSAAINAKLNNPTAVAVDGAGNLYIADKNNSRIRKVGTNGIITTVAGTNSAGYSGDGGAAVIANLNGPFGVAVDLTGQLFIGDTSNNRIRKVDTNGVITTVAGGGSGGDGGAATSASLNGPYGVALDPLGDLFIADSGNSRIRIVGTNGIITTAAGTGNIQSALGDGGAPANACLIIPYGVALDAAGNLYIADTYNERIRKALIYAGYPTLTLNSVSVLNAGDYTVVISNSYGAVTSAVASLTVEAPPVITSQPASQMVLVGTSPILSVAVAGSGPFEYLYYFAGTNLVQSGTSGTLALPIFSATNAGNYTVVVTNAWGSVTSRVATLTAAYPPSVTTSPGSQAVLPGTNLTLGVATGGTGPFNYQWQCNGATLPNDIITTVAGNGVGAPSSGAFSGDGAAATSASLDYPASVAVDAFGNLFIADQSNHRIRMVATNGIISTFAGDGTNGYSGEGGEATNASLDYPTGVAVDAFGKLYIADGSNDRIRKVDTSGIITTVAGNGAGAPTSGAFSGDGGAATNASFYGPIGVALDAFGNLYIADYSNDRIRKVDTHDIITTVAGNGIGAPNSGAFSGDGGAATNASFYGPIGVALDASGNFYIADMRNNRIRKVDNNGIISTIAGNGAGSYKGDGGPATNASLNGPYGVAVDLFGNLYIADTGNSVIRKVDINGVITTVAGGGSGPVGTATSIRLLIPSGVGVDSAGNLYIADTFNDIVREVILAGFPTLALTNVSATNAGSYSVVITSPYGSVTSAVATLTVQAPPVITIQPTNQNVLAGSSPSFSVSVAGSGPFGYSWYLTGTNLIQSDTNSTLTLPCVFTNNAGSYTVVVTNAYGSVTSAVAALTVAIPRTAPQIVAGDVCFGFVTNQFGFNLSGAFGQTIVVDGSTDLVIWTPLFTNTCGDGNPFYFYDPCWTNFAWRYYRARVP